MRSRALRVMLAGAAVALAASAVALAGAPLKGRTYTGGAPAWGVNVEGHKLRTHATGNITLTVSGNGRSVTVRFSTSSPVLYCVTQQHLHVQSTKATSISAGGNFRASVAERFAAGPGPPSIVQVVSGHFSGHSVSGSIRTQAAECGGRSSFSATAH